MKQLFITQTAQVVDIPANHKFTVESENDLNFQFTLSTQNDFNKGNAPEFLYSTNGKIQGSTTEDSILILKSDEPMHVILHINSRTKDYFLYGLAIGLFGLSVYMGYRIWKRKQHSYSTSTEQSTYQTPYIEVEVPITPAQSQTSDISQEMNIIPKEPKVPKEPPNPRSILERLSAI